MGTAESSVCGDVAKRCCRWLKGVCNRQRLQGPVRRSITKAELLEGLEIGSRGLGEE